MSKAPKPEWWFYHLQHTTLERAVGPLLEKCLERDWRVLAVSPEASRRAALDEARARLRGAKARRARVARRLQLARQASRQSGNN